MTSLFSADTSEPSTEWPRAALGDVCTVVSGATPKTKVPEFWDGDIVWITPTDLGKMDGRDITESVRLVTEAGFASCSTTLMEPGAVVMSSRAPIGHLGIARVPLCTNQGCKSFVPGPDVDTDYLYYALRFSVPAIQDLGTGATFKEVSKSKLSRFQIPLPPLDMQREIAATLQVQLELVSEARVNLEAQLAAAQSLPEAYLAQAFRGIEASRHRGIEASRHRGIEASRWPTVRLSEIADLIPARSLSRDGDAEVLAVTSACLTESGFSADGLKEARMSADSVAQATLSPGEVLLARSNTPELVGRASLYEGDPADVVASDLIIRVRVGPRAEPSYVGHYLSHLYLSGYWAERAGGASGTMKKVRRTQVRAVEMTLPPLDVQRRVVRALHQQQAGVRTLVSGLHVQASAAGAMPEAFLRAAFADRPVAVAA